MPAQRLGETPISVKRFDVLGQDANGLPGFMRHLGLFWSEGGTLQARDMVEVCDMGPPLSRGRDSQLQADAWGSVPLSIDEIQQVQLWIDERASEYDSRKLSGDKQYVICPHACEKIAPDGTVRYQRFSCAGFVIEAMREGGINLVVTDEASLPLVDEDTIKMAYPDVFPRDRDRKIMRRKFGLGEDGPWPIMLCGYVMHALNRTEVEVREELYQPKAEDGFFPKLGDV